MFSYSFLEEVARERQKDFQVEADKERMLAYIEAGRPGLQEKFLSGVGDLLIAAGSGLKQAVRPERQQTGRIAGPVSES